MKKKTSKLHELRNAIADYVCSEGCTCCQDIEAHTKAKERIAKLLRVPKYKDGSGYNFRSFRTKAGQT